MDVIINFLCWLRGSSHVAHELEGIALLEVKDGLLEVVGDAHLLQTDELLVAGVIIFPVLDIFLDCHREVSLDLPSEVVIYLEESLLLLCVGVEC